MQKFAKAAPGTHLTRRQVGDGIRSLADKGYRCLVQVGAFCRVGQQRVVQIDDARDVRPHQAHTMGPRIRHHLLLLGPAILARLAEPRGDNETGFNTFHGTVADGLEDVGCRNGDDGQIHRARHGAHLRIGGLTENRLGLPIDRIEPARKTLVEELAKQPVPPRVCTL